MSSAGERQSLLVATRQLWQAGGTRRFYRGLTVSLLVVVHLVITHFSFIDRAIRCLPVSLQTWHLLPKQCIKRGTQLFCDRHEYI